MGRSHIMWRLEAVCVCVCVCVCVIDSSRQRLRDRDGQRDRRTEHIQSIPQIEVVESSVRVLTSHYFKGGGGVICARPTTLIVFRSLPFYTYNQQLMYGHQQECLLLRKVLKMKLHLQERRQRLSRKQNSSPSWVTTIILQSYPQ